MGKGWEKGGLVRWKLGKGELVRWKFKKWKPLREKLWKPVEGKNLKMEACEVKIGKNGVTEREIGKRRSL